MAEQLAVEASPDTLLTAPDSTHGGPLPPPLPIATGSTLVLSGHHVATTAVSSLTTSNTAAAAAACATVNPGGACSNSAHSHWAYEPHTSLAALFAALFLISLCAHIAQAAYWKKLKLNLKPAWPWPLLVGLSWAMSSFAIRAAAAALEPDLQNRAHAAAAAVSEILGILAPLWLTLFHNLLLAQMATVYIAPDGKIFGLGGSRIALAFVGLGIEVLLLEGFGAVLLLLGLGLGRQEVGAKVLVAGIATQQAYMLVFAVFAARFHVRVARLKREHYPLPMFRPWRATLVLVYGSLALLTLFDALPVWCCGVIANLLHPARATLAGPEGDGLIPTSRLHPLKRYGPQK